MINKPEDKKAQWWNDFWDEQGQVTKVVCIIAPLECFSGYRYFK